MKKIDKFMLRGIVFIVLSSAGLVYEFFFAKPIRVIVVLGYICVFGIGLICIIYLRGKE